MSTAVFGIAGDESQAVMITDKLKEANFSSNDISVLFSDKSGTKDFAYEQQTKAPEGAAAGVGTGGTLGAVLGWLTGAGVIAIPGLGPLMAAGPLIGLLSGAGAGGAAGGFVGALVGMGVPEYEAKRYEGKIKEGNILISVHARDQARADEVEKIFTEAGARDISQSGEVTIREDQGDGRHSHEKERESDAKPPVISEEKTDAKRSNHYDPEKPGRQKPRV